MSKKSLNLFVRRLHQELNEYEHYRSLLNLESQTFVFNKRTLVSQTLKQLQKGKSILPSEILVPLKQELKRLADKHGDLLIANLESIAGSKLPKPGGKVTLVFSSSTEVPLPEYYKMDPLDLSAYQKVRLSYREILNNYFIDMQGWLEQNAEEYIVRNKDGSIKKSILYFFDTGHQEGYGVFERFIDEATLHIAKGMESEIGKDSEEARDRMLKDLKDLGIEITINKIDSKDSIVLKIESTYLNRFRGQKVSAISNTLRTAVSKFIEENPLEDLEGSDSIKTRKRKEVLHKALDPFKKIKNVKVTSEDIVIKKANTTKSNSYKSKVKVKSTKIDSKTALSKTKIKQKNRKPNSSLISLIGILNAKLPETVQKNMISPKLNYRSGRFASSVTVTDITPTTKGFPSIGYTYDKFPYQTFEPGYAQGSVDRDPRKLIDQSIREIAAQFAIGRFYTRRV